MRQHFLHFKPWEPVSGQIVFRQGRRPKILYCFMYTGWVVRASTQFWFSLQLDWQLSFTSNGVNLWDDFNSSLTTETPLDVQIQTKRFISPWLRGFELFLYHIDTVQRGNRICQSNAVYIMNGSWPLARTVAVTPGLSFSSPWWIIKHILSYTHTTKQMCL